MRIRYTREKLFKNSLERCTHIRDMTISFSFLIPTLENFSYKTPLYESITINIILKHEQNVELQYMLLNESCDELREMNNFNNFI